MARQARQKRDGARTPPTAGASKRAGASQKGEFDEAAQRVFLDQLASTANVLGSIRKAGFASSTVYGRRQRDPAFRAAWAEALGEGYAVLEAELLRRAVAGRLKPIFHAGQKVGKVREYSDAMALALLKRHGDAVAREIAGRAADQRDDDEVRAEFCALVAQIRERLAAEE